MRRLVAALLRLYPARFRRALGDDLLTAFDDQWAERRSWRQAARTIGNLAFGAACERAAKFTRRRTGRPIPAPKGDPSMTTLLQDLRFAARVLARNPGFTALAVSALALGIGANSAIFTLLDAVTFKPLPFFSPQDLVMMWERPPGFTHNSVAPLNFQDWNAQNHVFSSMAAISGGSLTYTGRDGTPELIPGQAVTTAFFEVLGVKPIAGRTFVAGDVQPKPAVIVLSERLWRSHFGADPSLVGNQITMDGRRLTVIGVVPAGFQILYKADCWTPFFIQQVPSWRQIHFLQVIGRLKPGITLDQARADMAVIAGNIGRLSPGTNKDWGVTAEPLRQALVGRELQSTSWVLAGVVGFVLLMACANVANLLLARGSARSRELAVRASIGGTRGRILQQLLTESALLAALGGAAGIGLAAVTLREAPSFLPAGLLPVWLHLSLDGRVAGFAIALAALTVVLFGLAPAWQAARVPLGDSLRAGGRGATGGSAFRAGLAAGEIAVAVLLVAGAGLLLRSLLSLTSVDAGFHAGNVLTMHLTLPLTRYRQPDRALEFYQAVERELAAIPGVRDVGLGFSLPAAGWQIGQSFQVSGQPQVEQAHQPAAHYQIVNSDYFRTLGIAMVRGRAFTADDTASNPPVCIVNQEFAKRYLAGRDPIGARVKVDAMAMGGPKPVERLVVGVSHQVKVEGLAEKEVPVEIYVPVTQNPWFSASIAVRTSGKPAAIVSAVKTAVAKVDKQQPVTQIRTMDEVVAESVAEPRFRAGLIGAFALIALTLAAVGVFGVLAFSVSRRTREFGIRMALGAQSSDVLRLVMREGMKITAAGIVAGLAGAAMLTRFLASLLFAVDPRDAPTFVIAAALLAVVALAACAVPALRAVRVDPAVALHHE